MTTTICSLTRHARVPAPLSLLVGMVALQTGSALAVTLFDAVGSLGVTWLRLSWAAVVLLALSGRGLPRAVRAATPRDLVSVVILGTVSAGMMVLYSEATARIDLGTATAVEFLGPLCVAVLALRRRAELAWIAAAVAGVLCLTRPWSAEVDLAGVAIGLTGALCVAMYIVLTQRVGGSFAVVHGIALSMTVAAVVTAPLGLPGVAANPSWQVALATLAVALLFPVAPFLLEMVVLQRMTRTAYSTFVSIEPAVALVMGMLVIAQRPAPIELAGVALVVVAGIGAARGTPRPGSPEGTSRSHRVDRRDERDDRHGDDRPGTAAGPRTGAGLHQG